MHAKKTEREMWPGYFMACGRTKGQPRGTMTPNKSMSRRDAPLIASAREEAGRSVRGRLKNFTHLRAPAARSTCNGAQTRPCMHAAGVVVRERRRHTPRCCLESYNVCHTPLTSSAGPAVDSSSSRRDVIRCKAAPGLGSLHCVGLLFALESLKATPGELRRARHVCGAEARAGCCGSALQITTSLLLLSARLLAELGLLCCGCNLNHRVVKSLPQRVDGVELTGLHGIAAVGEQNSDELTSGIVAHLRAWHHKGEHDGRGKNSHTNVPGTAYVHTHGPTHQCIRCACTSMTTYSHNHGTCS
jgi:hypothetical protein